MVSQCRSQTGIYTNGKHRNVTPEMLAAHGLSGCDLVITHFGIGKAVALRVLTAAAHVLSYLDDISHILSNGTAPGNTSLLAHYYHYHHQVRLAYIYFCPSVSVLHFVWKVFWY